MKKIILALAFLPALSFAASVKQNTVSIAVFNTTEQATQITYVTHQGKQSKPVSIELPASSRTLISVPVSNYGIRDTELSIVKASQTVTGTVGSVVKSATITSNFAPVLCVAQAGQALLIQGELTGAQNPPAVLLCSSAASNIGNPSK